MNLLPPASEMQRAIDVVYADDVLVAVHKPSGLFVHPTALDARVEDSLMGRLRDRLGAFVHPVHRLDRATSGLVLFARSADSAAHLGRQFEECRVEKRYLAIVRGHPPARGVIDHPLAVLDPDGRRRPDRPPQQALTEYRTRATVDLPFAVDRYPNTRYALVELSPRTGRRHQLRRHLKHIAHPIIGDVRYGKGVHNRFVAARSGVGRLLLACTRLHVVHPVSGTLLMLEAAPAEDFASVCRLFGWTATTEAYRAPEGEQTKNQEG